MQNVHAKEVQTQKGKDIQKSTEVPKKVNIKKMSLLTKLDEEIVVDEDVTSASKSKKHSSKKIWMRVLSFLINKLFIYIHQQKEEK